MLFLQSRFLFIDYARRLFSMFTNLIGVHFRLLLWIGPLRIGSSFEISLISSFELTTLGQSEIL